MRDDLLGQARYIVQLFRECSAIQLPHKPTEDVLTGMISRIETLTAERDALAEKLAKVTSAYRVEAMRREAYSHEALDRHIAELTGTP